MKKAEILKNIEENGGFDNFNNWNKKEIAEWVYYNYDCSRYIAEKVASEILYK